MIKKLFLVAILVAGSRQAMAGVSVEVMKGVGKVFGREASQEAVEAGAKNMAKSVANELVQEGSESIAKQTGKALVKSLGDDVARSATAASHDLAKGLGSLSAQNARRLQMLSSDLQASGKAAEVANLIAKGGSGDQVVDFLWRNKAAIGGGTVLTTLLMNPDAVIGATGDVGKVLISTAGSSIALPMIQHAPIMTGTLIIMTLFAILILVSVTILRRHPFWFLFRAMSALRASSAPKGDGETERQPSAIHQTVLPTDINRKQPI